MKKITLLFALIISSFAANAQIASGSVAPNFTATDINGVSHTLSDYLAAGKTVIMDVSATWCGPCWNYHNTHALEDLYESYGPGGSDEIVVLFIEGDATTGINDLNGLTAGTQGDWVTGTPYPIIDGSNIGSLYQIAYFPTLFRITPNGIVNLINTSSAVTVRNGINTALGTPMVGVQNHMKVDDSMLGLCNPTGNATVKVKNYSSNVSGVTPIVTVDMKENGTVVSSKSSAGTFAQFASKTLTFDPYTFDPSATYSFEINNINSQPNYNPLFSNSDLDITLAVDTELAIEVRVYTDNYPGEASWRIKNSAGAIVFTYGPYAGGSAAAGGVDANTTHIHNVTLPTNNECYTVELVDSYGDGWGLGSTPHGIEVFNGTTSIWSNLIENFGTLSSSQNALRANSLATNNFSNSEVSVYPNPSQGTLTIKSDTTVSVQLVDVLGKVVFTANNVTNNTLLDLTSLQKGLYIAKISGENINYSEKVILN